MPPLLFPVLAAHAASFLKAFEEAKIIAGEILEAEAIERATVGTPEPVYYRGRVVGYITRKSDTLLIFLLKGLMPEKYRDRWEGEVKVPMPVTVIIKQEGATEDEERQRPVEVLERLATGQRRHRGLPRTAERQPECHWTRKIYHRTPAAAGRPVPDAGPHPAPSA